MLRLFNSGKYSIQNCPYFLFMFIISIPEVRLELVLFHKCFNYDLGHHVETLTFYIEYARNNMLHF